MTALVLQRSSYHSATLHSRRRPDSAFASNGASRGTWVKRTRSLLAYFTQGHWPTPLRTNRDRSDREVRPHRIASPLVGFILQNQCKTSYLCYTCTTSETSSSPSAALRCSSSASVVTSLATSLSHMQQ